MAALTEETAHELTEAMVEHNSRKRRQQRHRLVWGLLAAVLVLFLVFGVTAVGALNESRARLDQAAREAKVAKVEAQRVKEGELADLKRCAFNDVGVFLGGVTPDPSCNPPKPGP